MLTAGKWCTLSGSIFNLQLQTLFVETFDIKVMSHNSQLKFSDVSTAWFSVQTGDNKVWQRDGVDQVPAQDGGQEPEQHPEQPQDVRPGQGGGDGPAQQHLPQHVEHRITH